MAGKDIDYSRPTPEEYRFPSEDSAIRAILESSKLMNLHTILQAGDTLFGRYTAASPEIPVIWESDQLHYDEGGGCTDPFFDTTDSLGSNVRGNQRLRNVHDPRNQAHLIFGETDVRQQFLDRGFGREIRGEFNTGSRNESGMQSVSYNMRLDNTVESHVAVELRMGKGFISLKYGCSPLGDTPPEEARIVRYYGNPEDFTAEAVKGLLEQFGLL